MIRWISKQSIMTQMGTAMMVVNPDGTIHAHAGFCF
jgi:hypothetical protein